MLTLKLAKGLLGTAQNKTLAELVLVTISDLCPGGILPVSWYTGMCHGFWVPFQQFWYRDGGVFPKK